MGKLSKLKDAVEGAITKLDMSHAARMQRARDMGFDVDNTLYHGTKADFEAFDPALRGSSTDPGWYGPGEYTTPHPASADAYAQSGFMEYEDGANVMPLFARDAEPVVNNYGNVTEYVTREPNQLRSVNAAFDPDKKDSANLLASLGGATVLGGAAMAPEEAEAGVVTKGGKKIIEAFHGSPHKFDKFSTANIGTGEGAQAYGHGLYFADSEDVARGYKRSTNYADKKRQFQNELPDDADIEEVMSMRGDGVFSDEMNTLLDALEQDDFLGYDSPARAITAAFSKDIKNYDPSPELLKAIDSGSLYQVDIDATPDELLDWDLPLSEQSEAVKQAYAGYLASDDSKDVARQWSRYQEGMGLDEAEPLLSITGDPSGNNLYRNAFKDREAANQYLTSAGIKGIKYKDGFSRGVDGVEGTSNYVIFDENIISIAKKYGVSLPVAGMIAAGATPQEAQASYNSVGDFVQRRAAKKEYWNGLKDRVKRRGGGARNENAQQEAQQAMLEAAAAVNRGLADTVDFVGAQVPNAVLNLVGSDQRVNSIYDLPGVNQATEGNYMEDSPTKDAIRFGGEMLSPL